DHPRYAWGQISSAPDPRHLLAYDPTHGVGQRRYVVPPPVARPLFGGGIATSDAAQQRERVLGSRTWIVPSSSLGERPGGRELREMVLWTLMRRRIPTDAALRVRKILFDVPGAAAAASAHIRSIIGMNRRWSFLTIVEPEPNRESRVLLDDVKDRFGQRRVKLDWRLTPLVERSLRFAQTAIVKDLRAVGVDCAVEGSSGPAGNQSIDEPRWVWHHMGTMRMSSDPTQGVVDANCKVHGMENLYVAGSSVFPTCSTDMPTLTLIALAHRLADHLSQKLADRPAEHESADRARRRIERHMAEARSPAGKTLAAFDFEGVPMVSKAQVMALASGDVWLNTGANLLLFGPPGGGKSHLSAAIGLALVENG